MQHSIRGLRSVDHHVDDNTNPTIHQDVNQPRRRNSHQGQESAPTDQPDQLSPGGLEPKLPRFGPVYGEDNTANQIAKKLAWQHILEHDSSADMYLSSIRKIEATAIKSYETGVIEKLKPGSEFRDMMVRDGCFFLQLAIYILGGGEHLNYSDQHPYFGRGKDPSQWIPAMFFAGNQIPYIVIPALMKQDFFQNLIKEGFDKGTWRRPPKELAKLVLYRTVVEPELKGLARLSVLFSRMKNQAPQFQDPPSDILHYLHAVLLGSGNDDPIYSEMKEFPDLEANKEDSDIRFPSAGELLKSGISLRKGKDGITNIRFRNLVIFARLDVPPLTIDSDTKHVLKNLVRYEQNLNECDREVTAYLRFMRDLAPTYKDFKILERSGIIQVKDSTSKYAMLLTINELVASHKCNFTLNFSYTRRRIADYEKPPWGFISFIFGVFTVVQTLFAVLPFFVAPKSS